MISNEYAAGFFDGEGCVNLTVAGKARRVVLRVMLVNTEPSILVAFHAQFGGVLPLPRVSRKGWKPFGMLTLTGHAAAAFLSDIAPFVRVKAAQVALGLEFWDYNQRPKSDRCDYIPRMGGSTGRLKPSVIVKEGEFKARMHGLNRKGAAA